MTELPSPGTPRPPDAMARADAGSSRVWTAAALLLVLLTALAVRYGTNLLEYENIRDERLMKVPIDQILRDGWSVRTAIDYQEVKGPAFFWSYAIGGAVFGGDIHGLRLTSVVFFVLGAWPLLLITRRVGWGGPSELLVAAMYMLLPYHLPQGQLLMSESSFVFLGLWSMWAFVWGFGRSSAEQRRVLGPVLFGVFLSIALHHRPHAVAFAGAAVLVASERDGVRSWPWWLACLLAGLSRLPLWWRWGGLVTSDYQGLFGFGIHPDALTYALAAALPSTGILLWPVVRDTGHRGRRRWVIAGGLVGLVLGVIAAPDLATTVQYDLPGPDPPAQQAEYAGVVATFTSRIFASGWQQRVAVAALAGLAGAALAALGVAAWTRRERDGAGVVGRLAFWMLAVGLPLYAISSGPVYDRYVLVWAILLPLVWVQNLSSWALAVQALALTAIAAYFVNLYFI
ncbi:MAG: ArnT family glycosyltransferase [Planctomycetota bacterium]|jgi:hypothetical protein